MVYVIFFCILPPPYLESKIIYKKMKGVKFWVFEITPQIRNYPTNSKLPLKFEITRMDAIYLQAFEVFLQVSDFPVREAPGQV